MQLIEKQLRPLFSPDGGVAVGPPREPQPCQFLNPVFIGVPFPSRHPPRRRAVLVRFFRLHIWLLALARLPRSLYLIVRQWERSPGVTKNGPRGKGRSLFLREMSCVPAASP